MKVVQIRGNNASGKTTSVRQFVQRNNLELEEIEVNGIKTNISVGKNVVVLGRYDKKTGGCDLFQNKEHVLSTIVWVIKNIKPETIIFEGLIYSFTYRFASVVSNTAKRYGYNYQAVCLYCPFDITMGRLYKRNGGNPVNEETIKLKTKAMLASYNKLLANGYAVKLLDTSNMDADKMFTIVEGAINER